MAEYKSPMEALRGRGGVELPSLMRSEGGVGLASLAFPAFLLDTIDLGRARGGFGGDKGRASGSDSDSTRSPSLTRELVATVFLFFFGRPGLRRGEGTGEANLRSFLAAVLVADLVTREADNEITGDGISGGLGPSSSSRVLITSCSSEISITTGSSTRPIDLPKLVE